MVALRVGQLVALLAARLADKLVAMTVVATVYWRAEQLVGMMVAHWADGMEYLKVGKSVVWWAV